MEREGRILTRDWSRYDITHVVFEPRCMPAAELEERYASMLRELFSYPEMIKRSLKTMLRRTVNGYPNGFTRFDRFTSTMAPNLVYRGLGRIGREDGIAEIQRDPKLELRPLSARLTEVAVAWPELAVSKTSLDAEASRDMAREEAAHPRSTG
jgi:hypothetical protein